MATHSSILAWRIPWTEAWPPTVHGVSKSQTWLFNWDKHLVSISSVVSNSLQPYGLQHARPPCSPPTPGVYSCPWVSDAIQPSHPLLSPSPPAPSIFPSIRVFSNESALRIRWTKYWSFSFNISPSSEYSGLISLGWTGWISLQSRDSQESATTPQYRPRNVLGTHLSPSMVKVED